MLKRTSSRLVFLFIGILLLISFFLEKKDVPTELHVSLAPESLFTIGSFPITNTFLWEMVLSAVLIGTAVKIFSSVKMIPSGLQNFLEIVVEGGFNVVKSVMGNDEHRAKRAFPLVFTMFLFILLTNLFTFLPGAAALSKGDAPIFRAVMSDYGMVFVMTLIAIVTVQIVAIISAGPFGYLKQFFDFSSPLNFVLGLMNIVGELAKILSLSFRLFGNMFAGEVLASVMLFLSPFFVPLPFAFLGLITAIIQAVVFAMLTTIFISMAADLAPPEKGAVGAT
jgi:F-type H+-transporting ATPase subunit a